MKKEKTAIVIGLISFVMIYVGVYTLLSCNGSYSDNLVISGAHRYNGGMGIPDAQVWNPKSIICLPYQKNALAHLFLPLISLDRNIVHKNIDAFQYRKFILENQFEGVKIVFDTLQLIEEQKISKAQVLIDSNIIDPTLRRAVPYFINKGDIEKAKWLCAVYIGAWIANESAHARPHPFPHVTDSTDVVSFVADFARYRKKHPEESDEHLQDIFDRSLEAEKQQKANTNEN